MIRVFLTLLVSRLSDVASLANPCNSFLCINKCCPENQLYLPTKFKSSDHYNCSPSSQEQVFQRVKKSHSFKNISLVGSEKFVCLVGHLEASGQLRVVLSDKVMIYNSHEFCTSYGYSSS